MIIQNVIAWALLIAGVVFIYEPIGVVFLVLALIGFLAIIVWD